MPTKIVVPELGESVVEATVGRWIKQPGDRVKVGEPLVELETDKVNLEVGADTEGVLASIAQPTGADVKIGDVLGMIEEATAGTSPTVPTATPAAAPAPKPATPAAAPITSAAAANHDAKPVELVVPITTPSTGAAAEKVTPVAMRVAQEHGIDVSQVEHSGNRVTKSDVERYLGGHDPAPASAPDIPASLPVPVPSQLVVQQPTALDPREERIRLSRRRRTIAQRLLEAQQTAAMLTTFNEVDMSGVMDLREKRKASFKEKYGVGLGVTSFFVKATIGALKEFPHLNAEIQGDEMVLKHYYDIGMAVAAPDGLVVPVLRDADRMSFAEIEKGIKNFASQAEKGTLALDDLRGGTFTITNGGVFGSLMSTPILNMPQVGILGLHGIKQRPVVLNGAIVARPMMYIALSYDHRIVDGSESVRFLVRVKDLIEDPTTLLIEG